MLTLALALALGSPTFPPLTIQYANTAGVECKRWAATPAGVVCTTYGRWRIRIDRPTSVPPPYWG